MAKMKTPYQPNLKRISISLLLNPKCHKKTCRFRINDALRDIRYAATAPLGLVWLATSLCLAAVSPSASGQSLNDALRSALTTHSGIGEARANRAATEAELDQARGLRLPRVDIEAFAGPATRDNRFGGTSTNNGMVFGGGANLLAQQTLYDGGAITAQIERESARVTSSALRVLSRVEAVALATTLAYLDVLRFTELRRSANRSVRSHERILGGLRTGVAEGGMGMADVRLAEERLAAARATEIEFSRRLVEAEATFRRNVGAPPQSLTRPTPPTAALAPTLQIAIERVQRLYPETVAAEADFNAAYADWRAASAARGPRVLLESRAGRLNNANGVNGQQNEFNLIVRLRFTLYDGGILASQQREQAARVTEARLRIERIREDVDLELRQAWAAMEFGRSSVRALSTQLRASRDVSAAFAQQFQAGRRSLIDLLNAENSLLSAEVGLAAAEFSRDASVFRILTLSGELLGNLGVAIPRDAVPDRGPGLTIPIVARSSDPWPLPPPVLVMPSNQELPRP